MNINNKKKKFTTAKKPAKRMVTKAQSAPRGEIEEYLYMLPVEVRAEDLLEVIEAPEEKKDVWHELDLMEIKLGHDGLIFENFMDCFDTKSDQAFLKENGVKKVYAFSYDSLDKAGAAKAVREIHAAFGGFIASDTKDLQPVYQPEEFG